jgi:cysteine desulfurase
LPPPWVGGGQENGMRPGTEAFHLLIGFGAAAAEIEQTRKRHQALAKHRDQFEKDLSARVNGIRYLGQQRPRLANTSAVVVDHVDGEALRLATDQAGLCVGFGSACSALAPEPSPALLSLGLTRQQARATIRISLAPGTSTATLINATERLEETILGLRKNR